VTMLSLSQIQMLHMSLVRFRDERAARAQAAARWRMALGEDADCHPDSAAGQPAEPVDGDGDLVSEFSLQQPPQAG
jgi:hypothetical protein